MRSIRPREQALKFSIETFSTGQLAARSSRIIFFFFGSYEGLRQRSAAAPTQINIYSNAQLAGTFGAGTFDVVMPTTDANGNPVPQPGQPALWTSNSIAHSGIWRSVSDERPCLRSWHALR